MNDHEASARGGRPQLPDSHRRDHRVVFMVTRSEFHSLKDLAEARKTSLSALCHHLLLNSLTFCRTAEVKDQDTSHLKD
ncbi:MAG: hypothetical protein AAF739_18110 [Pseudomonadota bacterium]